MRPPSPPARHPRPGSTLTAASGQPVVVGAWRGEGSYARVYRGLHGPGHHACAVKLAKTEIPEAAGRLSRERATLSALRHAHVVRLMDCGDWGETPFLVLEWLEGETLRDLLEARRRLPLRQALEVLEHLAGGLEHIHTRGMVHGDLRPENILMVPGRGAVLTDPGAHPAIPVRDAAPKPESQAEDTRALGRLFHRMLTGVDPAPAGAALGPNTGFSRATIELWDQTQSDPPAGAGSLRDAAGRLRRSL